MVVDKGVEDPDGRSSDESGDENPRGDGGERVLDVHGDANPMPGDPQSMIVTY